MLLSRVLHQTHGSAGVMSAFAGIAAFYLADAPVVQADSAATSSTLITKQSLETRYGVQKTIGRGGFALVEAGWEKGSNTPVAIKRVSKSLTSKAKFVHEVSILKQLQGLDHIVQLKDAFETPEDWILVTEYVQGGELFDRLVQKGTFSEGNARTITRELAQTLIGLHAQRLVHGDVKPENILLESTNDSARAILIDFGLSFRASEGRHPWDGSGTVAYAAPEVLTNSPDVTTAIDMWALGVVLFIVLGGYHPFDPKSELSDASVRLSILQGEFDFHETSWTGVSEDAKDLIRRLIVLDPAGRLSAAEVLDHPWLRNQSFSPDLNAALLVRCASKDSCDSRLHTYCFDPPRIATDDLDPWWCASCTPPPQSLPSMAVTKHAPVLSPSRKPCNDKNATLFYAKKRALPLPRPRKVPSLVPAVHPLQQVSPAWLEASKKPQQPGDPIAQHHGDDASIPSPRETTPTVHSNDRSAPLDWRTFCSDKAADLKQHPPAKPRHFKLQRIVLAWVHWRRKHSQDRRQRRLHVHMQEYATRASQNVMCDDATEGSNGQQWRDKYKADDLALLDAENNIHYSRGQFKPPTPVVRCIVPTAAVPKKPPIGLPPPKPPKMGPPELIQVDNYTIDLSGTPPTVETHATNVTKTLQDQAKQTQADQDAISRRRRTQHTQLLVHDKTARPHDVAAANATKIQRWYRRLRRDRRAHLERDAAATLINLCVRRYLNRKHRHDKGRRAKQAASGLLQSQRAADAKLALQLERRRKNARRRIEQFLSRHVVPHVNRKFHAIIRVQAFWRRCICQKAYHKNRRSRALVAIQCAWRQALARRTVSKRRELKAVAVLQRHIRGRYIRRVVLVEKKRVAMVEAVTALHAIPMPDPATASTSTLLTKLGLHYYGTGRWWAAAACIERACRNGLVRDVATTAALAYSHHQTWHSSYDPFNLTRAHDLYVTIVQASHGDPYVLHDYAVVLMERAEYKAGLDVLAHVLAVFPQFDQAPSAMLWVAVVLLHLDRGDESVSYFGCLLDTPPPPFSAIDMTILCALGYGRSHNLEACKQGLQTALAGCQGTSRSKVSKADMLVDLAKRATAHGHYLMAYLVFFYALQRLKHASKADTWFRFADTLRHLGKLDEALQALAAAAHLDPANTLVQTTLLNWPHLAKDPFVHELRHTIDLEFVRHLR